MILAPCNWYALSALPFLVGFSCAAHGCAPGFHCFGAYSAQIEFGQYHPAKNLFYFIDLIAQDYAEIFSRKTICMGIDNEDTSIGFRRAAFVSARIDSRAS